MYVWSLIVSLQKAEYKAASTGPTGADAGEDAVDHSAGKYGPSQLIQSQEKHADRTFVDVSELAAYVAKHPNTNVWVRGRVHTSRAKGKQCFLILRQQSSTVQCIIAVNDVVSKQMVKFCGSVSKESIVDIHVKIVPVATKIESCTEQTLELAVLEIYLVSAAKTQLPLQIEDASRPEKSDVSQSISDLDSATLDLVFFYCFQFMYSRIRTALIFASTRTHGLTIVCSTCAHRLTRQFSAWRRAFANCSVTFSRNEASPRFTHRKSFQRPVRAVPTSLP